jgi:hypothetical protein
MSDKDQRPRKGSVIAARVIWAAATLGAGDFLENNTDLEHPYSDASAAAGVLGSGPVNAIAKGIDHVLDTSERRIEERRLYGDVGSDLPL